MNNLLKRKYTNKRGSSCAMCKPHKHHHADRRTLRDIKADISTVEQLDASRSLATTPPS